MIRISAALCAVLRTRTCLGVGVLALAMASSGVAYGAPVCWFTPSGSQLDGDPISDIAIDAGQDIALDLWIDTDLSGIVLPLFPYDRLIVTWSFAYDSSELSLLSVENDSPLTLAFDSVFALGEVAFEALSLSDDGISDFDVSVEIIVHDTSGMGPDGDLTNQCTIPSPVEVQIPEPAALSLLAIGAMALVRRTKR